MGGIPGKTFGRPKITQHVTVGPQTAEKTELPSQKMVIGEVPFTKGTFGGAVDVSRQDIDWTSPAAWDILIRDLADVYAMARPRTPRPTPSRRGRRRQRGDRRRSRTTWKHGRPRCTTPAGLVYASSKRLPDRIWCSVDVWAIARTDRRSCSCRPRTSTGASSLSTFAGNMFNAAADRRSVVPGGDGHHRRARTRSKSTKKSSAY